MRKVIFLLSFLLGACSAPSPPSAGITDTDSGPSDSGGPRSDSAAERDVSAPRQHLPLSLAELHVVSTGTPSDYGATVLTTTTPHAIAFERFTSLTEFRSEIWTTQEVGALSFTAPVRAELGNEPLVSGPHATRLNGGDYLYFMAGNAADARARLYRAAYSSALELGPREELVLADTFSGMFAWPTVTTGPNGTVLLAYDHYQSATFVALGDGKTFGTSTQTGLGVQSRAAFFSDGAIVATFQAGVNGGAMMNYVRIASQDLTFSPKAPVTSTNTNVHDSFPFARHDGGVDAYYIAYGANGFSVYRRSVHRDGTYGEEERVTGSDVGSCAQPHPRRTDDSSIILTMACGNPGAGDTDVLGAVLIDDAP